MCGNHWPNAHEQYDSENRLKNSIQFWYSLDFGFKCFMLTLLRADSRYVSPPEITQTPVKMDPSSVIPPGLSKISLPRTNAKRIWPFKYGKSPVPRYLLSVGSNWISVKNAMEFVRQRNHFKFDELLHWHVHDLRGNSQSPFGTLARTSTRPNLKLNDFRERNLADTTGGRMRFNPACRSHSCFGSMNDVQLKWSK